MSVDVWDQLAQEQPVEARIKRDRWGRYRIPHPVTGKEQSWTRATTLASTLADRYGLEQWAKRNVVLGIGARRDLYTLAASCTELDKDDLNKIVSQAEEAAKGKAGANAGTAIHRFTERVDRGDDIHIGDPQIAGDIAAYTDTMRAAGIRVARSADGSGAWIERVLVVPDINVAGTCDRVCLSDTWPLPRIGDLKTGKDVLRYGMVEISLQLAIYAHASHWFDPATGRLHDMPTIDRERALVMHLPVGQGVCTLIDVDIAAGWEAVQLAVAVRDWRKRKDLAQIIPIVGSGAGEKPPAVAAAPSSPQAAPAPVLPTPESGAATPVRASTDRVLWLRSRVQAILDTGHGDALAAIWSQHPHVPTLRQGDLSDDDVTAAAGFCDDIEASAGIPFGDPDPALPPGGPPVEESAVVELDADRVDRRPTASEESEPWVEKGRAVLAQFQDADLERAIADCALCTDVLMNETRYLRLEAVAAQIATTDGAVEATYGPDGCHITPTGDAAERMSAGIAPFGKSHALHRAKRLAKTLEVPAPRSLAQAAENPLLAALVAAGWGAETS